MQSTGQTSTQAVSLTPMQGSAMMWVKAGLPSQMGQTEVARAEGNPLCQRIIPVSPPGGRRRRTALLEARGRKRRQLVGRAVEDQRRDLPCRPGGEEDAVPEVAAGDGDRQVA